MRRALTALLLIAATAAAAAFATGCGGSSSSGLDDALGYMPKSSLAVIAIKTDPDDDQYKNLEKLLDKFPFAGSIKSRIKSSLTFSGGRVNYDKDIKPMLGNDIVVSIQQPEFGAEGSTGGTRYVAAWKTAGGDPKKLITGDRQVGKERGATIYEDSDTSFDAIKGDTILSAKTRPLLSAALKAHDSGDGLNEDDFKTALGDLDKDALVRAEGNLQTILKSVPNSDKALTVPWVRGLRTFAATGASSADGVAFDFRVKTEGLTAAQQPLATGSAPAPVVKRPGEIGLGLRSPAQVVSFVEQVVSVTDPKSLLAKDKISKQLGVDLDKDVVAQMGGDSAGSFGLGGETAVRTDLKDPAKFRKTWATIIKNVPKAQRSQGKSVSTIRPGPQGLYVVTKPGGKPTAMGVVGDKFVIASDPTRAQEIAAQSASPEPGTKGALVLASDPKSLVAAVLKKSGNSGVTAVIGPALSAHLQALAGSVEAAADGLSGHFKLTVR